MNQKPQHFFKYTCFTCTHIVYNPHSVQQVQAKIKEFECRFKSLKKTTRDGLACVNVKELVVHITDLQADDMPDHKVFLERKLKVLFKATDHYEVFGCLNLYWNYLAPGLLEHIIEEFSGEQVKSQMKVYKIDLHQFMSITPAKVFCQAQTKRSDLRPPPGIAGRGGERHVIVRMGKLKMLKLCVDVPVKNISLLFLQASRS